MPESIYVNGSRKYVPGIPAEIDASSLSGRSVASGILAVVGTFPTMPQSVPQRFTRASAIRAYDPTDESLALLASLAFKPSPDDAVGSPEAVYLVNQQANTQAASSILDGVVLKSKVWGLKGNRTRAVWTASTRSLTINREGLTETFTVKADILGSVDLDLANFIGYVRASSSGVAFTWKRDPVAFAGGTVTISGMSTVKVDGQISFALESVPTTDVVLTVTGTNKITGASLVETVTFVGGAAIVQKTTTGSFSAIASITGTGPVAYTGEVEVLGYSLNANAATHRSVGSILNLASQLGHGWAVAQTSPSASSIPADSLDPLGLDEDAPVGDSNPSTLTAYAYQLSRLLSGSTLVEPTLLSNTGLSATNEDVFLFGGTEGADGWAAAFESLLPLDVSLVVPLSGAVSEHTIARDHCIEAASSEAERQAWVGVVAGETLADIAADYTKVINSRYVALIGQGATVRHPITGALVEVGPSYVALMCAALQCGTPPATPLTRKRLNVASIVGRWTPKLDNNEAIQAGICPLEDSAAGVRICRDVTTYLDDDNPILSQVSSVESLNTSVKRLRAQLDSSIGRSNVEITANALRGVVEKHLDQQVKDSVIRSWADVEITDNGSEYVIDYQAAPVEPVLWFRIRLHASRVGG